MFGGSFRRGRSSAHRPGAVHRAAPARKREKAADSIEAWLSSRELNGDAGRLAFAGFEMAFILMTYQRRRVLSYY